MRDIKKVNYTPHNKNTDWVRKGFYTSVIPILCQPAVSRTNIFGAGFLMKFQGKTYVVTAKHVVDIDNPVLLFTGTNRDDIFLETKYFNNIGINWVFHKDKDLAVLPLEIPGGFKRIINSSIIENKFTTNIQPGQTAKHLGYPNKMTGTWTDNGKPNNISSGAIGKIVSVDPNRIVISTPTRFGDSGGPLFIKMQFSPKLVGVISSTLILKDKINPESSVYLHKTTAIPMSFVHQIINSKEMKAQI